MGTVYALPEVIIANQTLRGQSETTTLLDRERLLLGWRPSGRRDRFEIEVSRGQEWQDVIRSSSRFYQVWLGTSRTDTDVTYQAQLGMRTESFVPEQKATSVYALLSYIPSYRGWVSGGPSVRITQDRMVGYGSYQSLDVMLQVGTGMRVKHVTPHLEVETSIPSYDPSLGSLRSFAGLNAQLMLPGRSRRFEKWHNTRTTARLSLGVESTRYFSPELVNSVAPRFWLQL
jgi:hypothetical protein